MESLVAFLKRISGGEDREPVKPFEDGMVLLVTAAADEHADPGKLLEAADDQVTVWHHQPLRCGESVLVVAPHEEIFTEVVRTADGKDGRISELHIFRRHA